MTRRRMTGGSTAPAVWSLLTALGLSAALVLALLRERDAGVADRAARVLSLARS